MKSFFIASEKDIKDGRTTDIYFRRTKEILRAKGRDKVKVSAEITTARAQ
jgi:nicotinate phosphoribosyltransferase